MRGSLIESQTRDSYHWGKHQRSSSARCWKIPKNHIENILLRYSIPPLTPNSEAFHQSLLPNKQYYERALDDFECFSHISWMTKRDILVTKNEDDRFTWYFWIDQPL